MLFREEPARGTKRSWKWMDGGPRVQRLAGSAALSGNQAPPGEEGRSPGEARP